MTKDQDKNQTGRRALFAGAGNSSPQEESISISEIKEIVTKITAIEETPPDSILPVFTPLVQKLITLVQEIHQQTDTVIDLEKILHLNKEQISTLQTENIQLSSERESYLNDLITSHTEFDRALEIFQYHEVPMVLTGPERSLYDANNAFCTLFSIARSQITTAHPPLDTYFPDELTITGPDNEPYTIVTLTPPVVPFDHEAQSLVILVKTVNPPEIAIKEQENTESLEEPEDLTEEYPSQVLLPRPVDPATLAFNQFPIPAVVINQYHTVVACNQAFGSLVARTKETIILRDIGSCGIRQSDIDRIIETLEDETSRQDETIVTHPDGSEKEVYFETCLIRRENDESLILIVAVPSAAELEAEPVQPANKPDNDLMFRMLLDLNPSATALLDEHAKVISANEGFSELTGLIPADLIGTDIRDIGVSIPDEVLSSGATEVQYLPGVIRIETTWGMQESSGMVVPVGTMGSGVTAILILQPLTPPSEKKVQLPEIPIRQEPEVIPEVRKIDQPTIEENSGTSYLELDTLPIPALVSDNKGKVIRVNNAFSRLAGTGPDQFEGRLRDELLVSASSGFIRASFPSGEYILREYSQSETDNEDRKIFWYLDISYETRKVTSLEEQIKNLGSEIQDLRKDQGITATSSQLNASEQIDIVEFELNEERYAIDITMVREVVEMQPITPLPRTPPYVIGIINLRGEVTHVIDLAILLGQRPRKDRSGQKIIIIPSDITNGEHIAIIVDNVQSVTEIMGRHVSLLGEDITTQIKTHIKGIIKITYDDILEKRTDTTQKTTLIIWLDIQKILHDIQGSA